MQLLVARHQPQSERAAQVAHPSDVKLLQVLVAEHWLVVVTRVAEQVAPALMQEVPHQSHSPLLPVRQEAQPPEVKPLQLSVAGQLLALVTGVDEQLTLVAMQVFAHHLHPLAPTQFPQPRALRLLHESVVAHSVMGATLQPLRGLDVVLD